MQSAIRLLIFCAAIAAMLCVPPSAATACDDTYAPYAQRQNQWTLIERDNYVGESVGTVRRKVGKPDWVRTTTAGRLSVKIPDERLDLYRGPGTVIRVYGYSTAERKKEVFFASEAGVWRVIGDVDYPKSLRW